MLKRTILTLALSTLLLPVAALAQPSATITLKSGEKLSGQIIDLGGAGFAVRVNGQDRNLPKGDVALIDFGGGDMSRADWDKVQSGSAVVWLKSGETITGDLFDIGGTNPLRITLKTASGERELSSNEVSRIALARPSGSVATSGTASQVPEGTGVAVPGNQQWTPTGITVRQGERVQFNTTGEVRLSSDPSDVAGAAGSRAQRRSQSAPLSQNLAGALIARVGNGEPFPIGDQTTVTMPASGQLFLGINDDHVADNEGGFRVEIRRAGRRR